MQPFSPTAERRRVRTLFVSDVHLGSRFAQAEAFAAFLEVYDPDFLYIVGDFIDGWSLRRGWYWPETNSRILQRLSAWAARGVTIRYTPGNHDAFLRQLLPGFDFGWCQVDNEFIHHAADQRRYLVTHGDLFDNVELRAEWLSHLGSLGYDALLWVDRCLNGIRRWLGRKPWPFSARIKARVKRVVTFLSDFERRLAEHAQARGCQGVICGHIHTPVIVCREQFAYCNTGDWVENCSAVVEFDDGELRLIRFSATTGLIAPHGPRVVPARAAQAADVAAPRAATTTAEVPL